MTKHLSTLSTLHYVYGAFVCLGGLAAIALIFLGGFLGSDMVASNTHGEPPPSWLGVFLQTFGVVLFVIIELWGILTMMAGGWIAKRKNRTGTLIMAGFNCLNMPLGILLGIFTFITLMDAEVKKEYGLI